MADQHNRNTAALAAKLRGDRPGATQEADLDLWSPLVKLHESELRPAARLLKTLELDKFRQPRLWQMEQGNRLELGEAGSDKPLLVVELKPRGPRRGSIVIWRWTDEAGPTPSITLSCRGDGAVVAMLEWRGSMNRAPIHVVFAPSATVDDVPVDSFSWTEMLAWVAVGDDVPACIDEAMESLTVALHRFNAAAPMTDSDPLAELWQGFDDVLDSITREWPAFMRWELCPGWLGVRDAHSGVAIVIGRERDHVGVSEIAVWIGDASPGGTFESRRPARVVSYQRENAARLAREAPPRRAIAAAMTALEARRR